MLNLKALSDFLLGTNIYCLNFRVNSPYFHLFRIE